MVERFAREDLLMLTPDTHAAQRRADVGPSALGEHTGEQRPGPGGLDPCLVSDPQACPETDILVAGVRDGLAALGLPAR